MDNLYQKELDFLLSKRYLDAKKIYNDGSSSRVVLDFNCKPIKLVQTEWKGKSIAIPDVSFILIGKLPNDEMVTEHGCRLRSLDLSNEGVLKILKELDIRKYFKYFGYFDIPYSITDTGQVKF